MANILKVFGEKVRNIRKNKGLSQEDLAEKSDLHNTYIGGIERGERNLSLKSIEKIARALKTPAYALLKKQDFIVSEESEGKLYASSKKKVSSSEQELLKHFRSIKSEEFKNSIISLLKTASKK